MLLMAETIEFHTGRCHQSRWIENFERVVGEAHYLLLAGSEACGRRELG
jgi:hypothetical protein